MTVLEVIRSQKKLRKARRQRSKKEKRSKREPLDGLGFSSGDGSNWRGAEDDPSDDACSVMSEIDLESSISWTPDPRQRLRPRDEMFVDEDQGVVEDVEQYEEEDYRGEEEELREWNEIPDVGSSHAYSAAVSLSGLLDFNVEADINNSRKLLSSMGFIGFDDGDDDIQQFTSSSILAGSEVQTDKTNVVGSAWTVGNKVIISTLGKGVKKEAEPEIKKLEELLQFGFINQQQFQVLEKEAREEIERRKAVYKKMKDRRKRIAKKKKKAKQRALEARTAANQGSDTQDNEAESSQSKVNTKTNKADRGSSTARGRGGGADTSGRGARGGTRGGSESGGRGGSRGDINGVGRGGRGGPPIIRGRGGSDSNRGGERGRGRGRGVNRDRGGGVPDNRNSSASQT